MTEFKREDRYLVLKRSDIPRLSKNDQQRLSQIAFRVESARLMDSKRKLKCVVVESDWPEYETVFRMIEARVTGQSLRAEIVRCAACQTPNSCGSDGKCLEDYIKVRIGTAKEEAARYRGLRAALIADDQSFLERAAQQIPDDDTPISDQMVDAAFDAAMAATPQGVSS